MVWGRLELETSFTFSLDRRRLLKPFESLLRVNRLDPMVKGQVKSFNQTGCPGMTQDIGEGYVSRSRRGSKSHVYYMSESPVNLTESSFSITSTHWNERVKNLTWPSIFLQFNAGRTSSSSRSYGLGKSRFSSGPLPDSSKPSNPLPPSPWPTRRMDTCVSIRVSSLPSQGYLGGA